MWRKKNPCPLLMERVSRFLKNIIERRYDPAIPRPGYVFKESKSIPRKDICTSLFNVALLTITKTRKQPISPSAGKWIKKMWYVYTMEYYSAIKKNEMLPFVTPWADLKGIILSQWEKDKYCMALLTCGTLKQHREETEIMHTENRLVGTYPFPEAGSMGWEKWAKGIKLSSSYKISKSWGYNILHDA